MPGVDVSGGLCGYLWETGGTRGGVSCAWGGPWGCWTLWFRAAPGHSAPGTKYLPPLGKTLPGRDRANGGLPLWGWWGQCVPPPGSPHGTVCVCPPKLSPSCPGLGAPSACPSAQLPAVPAPAGSIRPVAELPHCFVKDPAQVLLGLGGSSCSCGRCELGVGSSFCPRFPVPGSGVIFCPLFGRFVG